VSETAAAPVSTAGTAEEQASAVGRLRRSSLGQLLILLVQAGLGMVVNLYASLPAADQGKGVMASFGDAVAKGPASLAIHAIVGMLVLINACMLIVFSLTVRSMTARVCSAIGLVCVIGAAMSGAAFVNAAPNSGNGASLTMALLTLVALACYAVNLFVLGGVRDEAGAGEGRGRTAG
jgi:hypothetical protein